MKTFILFLGCSLFLYSAQAQISKGSILLGGSFGFAYVNNHGGSSDYKANGLALQPSFGFVVKDNRAIGINLMFTRSIWDNGSNATTTSTEYGGGAFYRLYHPLGKRFYIYGEGEANVFESKQESPSFNEYTRQTFVELKFVPGIAYTLNKRFHVELSLTNMLNLGYGWGHTESAISVPSYNKINSMYFQVDPNPMADVALGFRVLLGK
jgi:hypothetical protein